jgi:hypothetical protein
VSVALVNEGLTPIHIRDVFVTTTINGKGAEGRVAPATATVPARERAPLFTARDYWRTETESWTMTVVVRTTVDETFRNDLTWR